MLFGQEKTVKTGFTLIEILVVMLVIGVLASVAVPWYQHAVMKSRFGTVAASAKALLQAQEVYYLSRGTYATHPEDLDVSMPQDSSQVEISLGVEPDYKFVVAHHTKNPNVRYVMYQLHSDNFSNNIHCEAKTGDEEANWLCADELDGLKIGNGSISGQGYTAYILEGKPSDGSFSTVPITYYNTSNLIVTHGGRCEANTQGGCSNSSFTGSTCVGGSAQGCQHSEFTDSTCQGQGRGKNASSTVCGYSTFDNSTCYNESGDGFVCGRSDYVSNSACYSNATGGCGHATYSNNSYCYAESPTSCEASTFANSTCIADGTGGCEGSSFTDSTCYAKSAGSSNKRACGSGSTYDHSTCYNQSNAMYGCGAASYTNGSSCYSNTTGGCGGKSTFSGGSSCYGNGSGACGSNTYSDGSVCYANVSGACNSNTYKDTSYCSGKFCPKGSPRSDGTIRTAEGE